MPSVQFWQYLRFDQHLDCRVYYGRFVGNTHLGKTSQVAVKEIRVTVVQMKPRLAEVSENLVQMSSFLEKIFSYNAANRRPTGLSSGGTSTARRLCHSEERSDEESSFTVTDCRPKTRFFAPFGRSE